MKSSRRLWRRHCNQRIYLQYQQLLDSTLLEKSFFHPHLRQKSRYGSTNFASSGMKLKCNVHVIAPQCNPTLPCSAGLSLQCQMGSSQSKAAVHFPKNAFALWQFRIKNCIFSTQFSLIVLIMRHPTPIGIRHEVLALAHQGKCHVVTWVWLGLPSTAFYGGMMPLELWHQASPQGLLGRTHLV